MDKFQVSITFFMDEEFMRFVPSHRTYINRLINEGVIDSYSVSLEAGKSWIIFNAASRDAVETHLRKSSLYKYWEYEIDQLFIYDSQLYRFPKLVMN
ncbi:MAG: hypothetical protein H7Y04_09470 [Verrucomicrobia bacterium]|nr:hypothetical protein [Cytophagales bacterium]